MSEVNKKIKKILKKYNVKGTVSTRKGKWMMLTAKGTPSTRNGKWVVLTVSSGEIDFYGSHKKTDCGIRLHGLGQKDRFSGTARDFLGEALNVLCEGNSDENVEVQILSNYQLLTKCK